MFGCSFENKRPNFINKIRLDIYEPLNRTRSRIVRVAAASGLAHKFRIVLRPKIKNSTSSVYSRLYGMQIGYYERLLVSEDFRFI